MAGESAFECPKCGKQSLVRLQDEKDVFECIYCHYRDDLHVPPEQGSRSWLLAAILAIFVALALMAG